MTDLFQYFEPVYAYVIETYNITADVAGYFAMVLATVLCIVSITFVCGCTYKLLSQLLGAGGGKR